MTQGAACSSDDLRALARKYEALARLRRDREKGGAVAPRSELRELAREFPGSLRELDTVHLDEIDRRVRALSDAARGIGPIEPWMSWMSAYHATMRAALFVKARVSLAPNMSVDVVRRVAADATTHLGQAIDLAFVRAVAAPPRGRLNAFVFDRLGREFGVPAELMRRALFPSARAVLP